MLNIAQNYIVYFLADPLTTFPNDYPTSSLPRIRRAPPTRYATVIRVVKQHFFFLCEEERCVETLITAAKETLCSSPLLREKVRFFLETLQHNNGDAQMETSLENAFLQTSSFAITVKVGKLSQ